MESPIDGELPEAEPGSDRDIAARVEEHLLGGPRRFRRNQVAAVSDVDLVYVRRLWRAMGFANVGDDAVAFTEGDVLALDQLLHLVKDEVVDKEFADTFQKLMRAALGTNNVDRHLSPAQAAVERAVVAGLGRDVANTNNM